MLNAGTGAAPIAYEQSTISGVLQKRLIEHVRTLYRPDDMGASQNDPKALLPLAQMQALALPGESYKLAFTPGLLAKVYKRPPRSTCNRQVQLCLRTCCPTPPMCSVAKAATGAAMSITDHNGHWWIPAGRVFLSPNSGDTSAQELAHARQHFFLPHRFRDPFPDRLRSAPRARHLRRTTIF